MKDIVSWLVPDHVLKITLPKQTTTELLAKITAEVDNILDRQTEKVIMYIEANDLNVTYTSADVLRTMLPITANEHLDCMVTMSNNKLTRLILLMAFSVASVPVMRFEEQQQVNDYLLNRGLLN